MPRPEHVACVARNNLAHHGESWCGRRVAMEFVFITLDHAAENGAAGGRLTVCPECLKAAVAALSHGVEACHECGRGEVIDGKCDRCNFTVPAAPARPLATLKEAEQRAAGAALPPASETVPQVSDRSVCTTCKRPAHLGRCADADRTAWAPDGVVVPDDETFCTGESKP